jgi:hypothetical protein
MLSLTIPMRAVTFGTLTWESQAIVKKYKNNRKHVNKQSYERGQSKAKNSKGKNMGDYLKNDYLTLAKKDKRNYAGQSDLFSNGDLIFALAMHNYNEV